MKPSDAERWRAQLSRPGAHGATRIGAFVTSSAEDPGGTTREALSTSMLTARFRHKKVTTKVALEPNAYFVLIIVREEVVDLVEVVHLLQQNDQFPFVEIQ